MGSEIVSLMNPSTFFHMVLLVIFSIHVVMVAFFSLDVCDLEAMNA